MPVLSFRITEAEADAYKRAGRGEFLPMATWCRRTLNLAAKLGAPSEPTKPDASAPAGPGNPTKNRVMRGGERLSWESYYAGRLVDNAGPDGAPRFGAVMRDPRFADVPAAHIAYGEAMRECFARGVPVQPGDDHAWARYLRENS
jgi:hypothetical protein